MLGWRRDRRTRSPAATFTWPHIGRRSGPGGAAAGSVGPDPAPDLPVAQAPQHPGHQCPQHHHRVRRRPAVPPAIATLPRNPPSATGAMMPTVCAAASGQPSAGRRISDALPTAATNATQSPLSSGSPDPERHRPEERNYRLESLPAIGRQGTGSTSEPQLHDSGGGISRPQPFRGRRVRGATHHWHLRNGDVTENSVDMHLVRYWQGAASSRSPRGAQPWIQRHRKTRAQYRDGFPSATVSADFVANTVRACILPPILRDLSSASAS